MRHVTAELLSKLQAVQGVSHAKTTIKNEHGLVVAECRGHGRDPAVDVAIAMRIVHMCNCYDDLVEALKALIRERDLTNSSKVWNLVHAALEKSEGLTP